MNAVIEYYMEEIWKIPRNQLGKDNNMGNFRWIESFISSTGENVVWVEGVPGVTSKKIKRKY